jgi:hypothetical protein
MIALAERNLTIIAYFRTEQKSFASYTISPRLNPKQPLDFTDKIIASFPQSPLLPFPGEIA